MCAASPTSGPLADPAAEALLHRIGGRVRRLREEQGLTRRALADLCELSPRFLGQVESGTGNIAVTRLARVAQALGTDLAALVGAPTAAERDRRPVVALLGLRGAGKSSLGAAVAAALGQPFAEHDRLVEEEAGMQLSELFSLHGEAYYRRLGREVLEAWLRRSDARGVLATSGGIVSDPEAFELLRATTHTVWLQASPEDHWSRVVAQGDFRPMRDHQNAMAELRRLLRDRRALYALAEHRLDTSASPFDGVCERLVALTRRLLSEQVPAA